MSSLVHFFFFLPLLTRTSATPPHLLVRIPRPGCIFHQSNGDRTGTDIFTRAAPANAVTSLAKSSQSSKAAKQGDPLEERRAFSVVVGAADLAHCGEDGEAAVDAVDSCFVSTATQ